MQWGCFSSKGPDSIDLIRSIMDSRKYLVILHRNRATSAKKPKLGRGWIFQQENNPEHIKIHSEWLNEHKKQAFAMTIPLPWPKSNWKPGGWAEEEIAHEKAIILILHWGMVENPSCCVFTREISVVLCWQKGVAQNPKWGGVLIITTRMFFGITFIL